VTMASMKPKTALRIAQSLLAVALMALFLTPARSTFAQEQSHTPPAQQTSASKTSGTKDEDTKSASGPKGFGRELAEQTREATGAEEENADLKHSATVRLLARMTGLNVHGAHLLALTLNFAVIVAVVIWAGRKYLPGMFRKRSEAIQQALTEARAASQDANRRLADIENRLRQLDVEIGQMQLAAEKEANAEDERIAKATEEDIRKVVRAAEQEIAAAAKQARRELSTHTADLAIALARAQINVDPNTDQMLVRTFATHLAPSDLHKDDDRGKDGR
jgi:F-type H+-transporting ATPase subunit b